MRFGHEENLVPIHRQLNSQMSRDCEEEVKSRVLGQNSRELQNQRRLQLGLNDCTHIDDENDLPTAITLAACEMKKKSGHGRGPAGGSGFQ